MRHWRQAFGEATAGLGGITISDEYTDDFPSRLAGADVLVLAYNFDEDSLRYIRLSMPNKLPEYLASGAPVLAVGPRAANGIDYVCREAWPVASPTGILNSWRGPYGASALTRATGTSWPSRRRPGRSSTST